MTTFEGPSNFELAYGLTGFCILVIAAIFLAVKKYQHRN
jgi:hypothetical protein